MARRLNSWLTAYAEFTDVSEAPISFNFWTGVSTIAGALQRKVWIDEIKFKWYPNFYVILVSPPGIATKSSTMGVGMKMLRSIEGIHFGPTSMTWQGLTRGLQEGQILLPIHDNLNLVDPLQEFMSMSAITCEVSELGTFLDMRDTQLQAVLIDLWDGKDVPWERWLSQNENTRIENPWINLISATTPTWLGENFGDLTIGGGLTSRIIFVYADGKRQLIPYISDMVNHEDHIKLGEDLIYDLKQIAKLKGQFKLTDEARQFGREWYGMNWTDPEDHLQNGRLSGYRARKQTHIHKLAMVLSASERDDMIITVRHLETALMMMASIEKDMIEVFNQIGRGKAIRHMEELRGVLMVKPRITKMELWRKMMHFMSGKEFSEAIDGLIAAGMASIRNEGGMFYLYNTIFEGAYKNGHDSENTGNGIQDRNQPDEGTGVDSDIQQPGDGGREGLYNDV